MGVVRGLTAINSHLDAIEAKFNNKAEKAVWFKIKDKQSVKVAFLQELDENSENFSVKNDLGILAVEHVSPENFMIKALCSAGDGDCYGCEEYAEFTEESKPWRPKNRLYINVLVDLEDGTDPYVAILSQGNGPKSITPTLIEDATENGTITDRWFKIKRTGSSNTDTSYTLLPTKPHGLNVEDYELYDLNNIVRDIPYGEQAAFYNRDSNGNASAPRESAGSKPVADDTDTW